MANTRDIDICNLALDALGNTRVIASMAEPCTEAKLCSRHYTIERQKLLKKYPWNFATTITALTLSEETDSKYEYVYEYPEDALRIFSVNHDGDDTEDEYFVLRIIDNVQYIATDVEDATAKYVGDVQDCDQMPAEFIDALGLMLASRLALPLSSNAQIAQAVYQQALMAVDYAQKMCVMEQKEEPVKTNKWLDAR